MCERGFHRRCRPARGPADGRARRVWWQVHTGFTLADRKWRVFRSAGAGAARRGRGPGRSGRPRAAVARMRRTDCPLHTRWPPENPHLCAVLAAGRRAEVEGFQGRVALSRPSRCAAATPWTPKGLSARAKPRPAGPTRCLSAPRRPPAHGAQARAAAWSGPRPADRRPAGPRVRPAPCIPAPDVLKSLRQVLHPSTQVPENPPQGPVSTHPNCSKSLVHKYFSRSKELKWH